MASQFARIVAELKRQERRLATELTKVREAISLLEFGGGGVPAPAIIETPKAVRVRGRIRRPRKSRKAEAPGRKRR
jgi:hypothetical protein